MLKKIFSLFLLVLLTSCSWADVEDVISKAEKVFRENEYVIFHQTPPEPVALQDFSIDDIVTLDDISFRATPDEEVLNTLVDMIDLAEEKVYLEVYIFTEKRLKKALKDAKARGVEVKVILEKNIYLAGNLNAQTYKELTNAGVEVVYSNAKNYALNHTKMLIVDDEVVVSTGNYSYSSFTQNREFFVFFHDTSYANIFEEIFVKDFVGEYANFDTPYLVLSPYSARVKLDTLLKSATTSIDMYTYNISDEYIVSTLKQKHLEGVEVKMIFPTLSKVDSNADIIYDFQEIGIPLTMSRKPEIHAKAILVDEQYLYIGSVNFSTYSIEKNREIGIVFSNREIITQFLEIFEQDFK